MTTTTTIAYDYVKPTPSKIFIQNVYTVNNSINLISKKKIFFQKAVNVRYEKVYKFLNSYAIKISPQLMNLAPILWIIHYRKVFYFSNYNFYVQLSMELRKNTPRQKFDALTKNY